MFLFKTNGALKLQLQNLLYYIGSEVLQLRTHYCKVGDDLVCLVTWCHMIAESSRPLLGGSPCYQCHHYPVRF